jgi:hypothetical protein
MSRTLVASDTFPYSDGLLDTVSSGNWRYNWRFFGGFTMTSGALTGGDSSGQELGAARWTGSGTFTADQYSSVVIKGIQGGFTGHKIGPACRISTDYDDGGSGSRDFYAFQILDNGTDSSNGESIIKVVNGVKTVLASATAQTWVDNDVADIEAEGTTIRGIQNGTLKLSTTDSDLATGAPGFAGSTSSPFTIDNWEGGNITTGGGGPQSYSYTATGGLTFGGTSSALRGRVASASGGLLFGGTSAVARGRTVAASGGLVFGGVSTVQRGATRTATGGITFGGTAAAARGGSRVASGGIVFGGSAPFSSHNTNRTVIASGGIVFGGTSGISYGGGTVQQFGDELISAFVVTRASIYSSIRSILCR